jgi:hypothetical protein
VQLSVRERGVATVAIQTRTPGDRDDRRRGIEQHQDILGADGHSNV